MTEMTERVLNPTKIRIRINEDGELVFSRPDINGKYFDTDVRKEDLLTALCSCLFPLDNFKNTLEKEEDDPGPLYYLLESMIADAYDKTAENANLQIRQIGDFDTGTKRTNCPICCR